MAEEFIEDIIAAKEPGIETIADGASEILSNDVVEKEDKSSSTSDDAKHTNAKELSDLDIKSTAPDDIAKVEELASQLGWNKDHQGVEAVDAATYILRSKDIQKTLKDHNKDLKSQLKGLQSSVEALQSHNERVYQADVKKLQTELNALRKEKKAAIELADVEKVEELDKQIEDVQKDIDKPVQTKTTSNNPIYDEWVAENDWYLKDDEMAQFADTVAEQYQGAPLQRVYAIVRQKVAEVFPEKFETVKVSETVSDKTDNKTATLEKVIGPKSPVEKGSRNGDTATFTKADLSPAQINIMNQFVQGGIMTEEQYIADIAKLQNQ